MGKRVVLLLVIAVVMMALVAEDTAANIPKIIDHGPCTPSDTRICLDVSCSILAGNNDIARASRFLGSTNWYTHAPQDQLIERHINIKIDSPQMLEALTVVCEFQEFKTMFCTHRSEWSTSVEVERRYVDPDGNSKKEVFIIPQVTAFTCEDWSPPRILINEEIRDYETGNREVYFTITDNENSFLMSDDETGLSHCGYKILNDGESYEEIRRARSGFANNPTNPNTWNRISDCTPEAGELLLEASDGITAPLNRKIVFYAEDTKQNFRYIELPAITIYPSLPLTENNGFCPIENQCLIFGRGDDTIHDFSGYGQTNHPVPVCVNAGSTVNDVYCDSTKGLIGKSERLLDIAILAGIQESQHSFLAYCNPNTARYGTWEDESTIIPTCSNTTNRRDEAACMNACMLLYDNRDRSALFSSTNRQNSPFQMPKLLPGSIGSCTDQTIPFAHQRCSASIRSITLNSVFVRSDGLLHVGWEFPFITRNLAITQDQRQTLVTNHITGLLNSINRSISDYHIGVLNEVEVNPSLYKSSIGTHRISAFMKHEDKYVLGLVIPTRRNDMPFLVSVAYRGYSQAELNNFIVSSRSSIITLRQPRIYSYGEHVVVIGFAQNANEASEYIERLVNRINVR